MSGQLCPEDTAQISNGASSLTTTFADCTKTFLQGIYRALCSSQNGLQILAGHGPYGWTNTICQSARWWVCYHRHASGVQPAYCFIGLPFSWTGQSCWEGEIYIGTSQHGLGDDNHVRLLQTEGVSERSVVPLYVNVCFNKDHIPTIFYHALQAQLLQKMQHRTMIRSPTYFHEWVHLNHSNETRLILLIVYISDSHPGVLGNIYIVLS